MRGAKRERERDEVNVSDDDETEEPLFWEMFTTFVLVWPENVSCMEKILKTIPYASSLSHIYSILMMITLAIHAKIKFYVYTKKAAYKCVNFIK